LVANVAEGRIEQGASTITQQLARNAIAGVGEDDSLARKLREAHTAVRLEEEYSKDEILELYLNDVYFGGGAHGIGTAAQRYFGVSPKKLRLPQAALLAGAIAAPGRFSPYVDEDAARARRNVVLDRMAALGWIGDKRAEKAKSAPLGYREGEPFALRQPRAPFFVEYIKRQILRDERFGDTRRARRRLLYQGGLRIDTTLDLSLQRAARRTARRHLPRPNDPEAAVVAVDPRTGAIVTLLGGKDFDRQKYNLATQGRRQAGSAFKPFTLVAALERGISSMRRYDGSSPKRIRLPNGKVWKVRNAGGSSYGRIDLRRATQSSVNTVFAQLIMDVGPERVARAARRMGIESRLPAVPSLALGTASVAPLDMASAFGTLARGGVRCEPFAIAKVTDRSGEVLFEDSRGNCERVVRNPIAARVVSMLRRVVEDGTGTEARLPGPPVFGKTGTTDDFADAWFVGCARQLCTSTWVGHVEGRIPMEDVHGTTVYGGTFPARIWHDFMQTAMD
ncbi:MAG TPA: transglycosylase domain-containing protein, partial [Actinomycetota bacterium]|nr:transglycosylase domain-containing protein [Actinomycetota bacterium]